MRYRSFLFAIFCNINLHQFQGEERMQVIGVVWWQTQSCWLAISNWVTLKLYNLHHAIGGLHDSQVHCFCPEFLHLDVTEINCTYFALFLSSHFVCSLFVFHKPHNFLGLPLLPFIAERCNSSIPNCRLRKPFSLDFHLWD